MSDEDFTKRLVADHCMTIDQLFSLYLVRAADCVVTCNTTIYLTDLKVLINEGQQFYITLNDGNPFENVLVLCDEYGTAKEKLIGRHCFTSVLRFMNHV